MAKPVVKLFQDPAVAARAIKELVAIGVRAGDIGIAVKTDEAFETLAKGVEVALTAKIEAPISGTIALSGPAAGGNSLDSLADIWGIPKEVMFYYESGLQRGGVVISVHADEAGAGSARAALRGVDSFHIIPVDPPLNDRPFFLSERATKTDHRDKLFSGDFRKY